MTDNTSAWDKGKAEARKRFGKQEPKPKVLTEADQPDDTPTGPAAGIAEARRRFGNRTK